MSRMDGKKTHTTQSVHCSGINHTEFTLYVVDQSGTLYVVTKRYECSEGLDAFIFFLKEEPYSRQNYCQVKSIHPRTSETFYPRDVFGYELKFWSISESGIRPMYQIHQNDSKSFPCSSKSYTKTSHATLWDVADHCQNGSSNFIFPYRVQPRSTRIVVA